MIPPHREVMLAKVAKRTFSLPPEQAAYIDAKVEDGAYASGSEVVRAGLRALRERDAAVERWLSEEVALKRRTVDGSIEYLIDGEQ